jgi:hypothetical protein
MLTVSITRLQSLFTTSHDFFPSLKFQIRTTAITFDSHTVFLLFCLLKIHLTFLTLATLHLSCFVLHLNFSIVRCRTS